MGEDLAVAVVLLLMLSAGPILALGIGLLVVWGRVRRLEAQVRAMGEDVRPEAPRPVLRPAPVVAPVVEAAPVAPVAPPPVVAPRPVVPEPEASEPVVWEIPPRPPPVSIERLALWAGGGLGALLLLAGGLLGVQEAIDQGWLGPGVRVSLAALGGAGLWAGSLRAREGARFLGAALGGTGVGVLYGALFAAASLYGFVGPTLAAGLAFGLTALALGDAVRADARLQASIATLGALLTPVVVSSDDPSAWGLAGWLVATAALAGGASARRGWPEVAGLAWFGLALLAGAGAAELAPEAVASAMPLAVGAVFAAAALWRQDVPATSAVLGAGALTLPWLGLFAGDGAPGIVLAGVPVAVAALSAALAVRHDRDLWLVAGWGLGLVGAMGVAVLAHEGGDPRGWILVCAGIAPGLIAWGARPRASAWALDPWPLVAAVPVGVWVADDDTRLAGTVAALVLAATGLFGWRGGSGARVPIAGIAAAVALLEPVSDAPGMDRPTLHALAGLAVAALAAWPAVVLPGDDRWRRAVAGAAWPAVIVAVPVAVALDDAYGARWAGPAWLAVQSAVVLVLAVRGGLSAAGWRAAWVGGAGWALAIAAVGDGLDGFAQVAAFAALVGLAAEAVRVGHRGSIPWLLAGAAWVALDLAVDPSLAGDVGALGVARTVGAFGVPAALLGAATWRLSMEPGSTPWATVVGGAALGSAFVAVNMVVGAVSMGVHGDGSPWADPSFWIGALRSVSWAALGLVLLGAGLGIGRRGLRLAGFALVMLAGVKGFAVDLWSLAGLARVASALGLGGTLVAAAFGFQRVVGRDVPPADP